MTWSLTREQADRVRVLDCTLRDGGYYCDWDFRDATVARYLDAVEQAGIPDVEIGFRSNAPEGFAGKYRFCWDHTLRALFAGRALRVAVMIDGKDFIAAPGRIDRESLDRVFAPAADSAVTMVRVTTTAQTVDDVAAIAAWLQALGYVVSVNLMQVSTISPAAIGAVAARLAAAPVDAMYLADSFGGLDPAETVERIGAVKAQFPRMVGFHAHDNLGLALANSIAAIAAGADLIDGAVVGMGRGAGNLRTEQLLLYLRSKIGGTRYDPAPLFDVALTEFAELQHRHQWGTNLPYMLAGVYNVHPMYPQRLLQVRRYGALEIVRMLESLAESGRGKTFHPDHLAAALKERFTRMAGRVAVTKLPGFCAGVPRPDAPALRRPVLILGSGPSVRERAADINAYIVRHQPVVIECNVQSAITPAATHYTCFTNYRRFVEHFPSLGPARRHVVLGMQEIAEELAARMPAVGVTHYPYRVAEGRVEVEDEGCTIPHDVVGMFAILFAIRLGATEMRLCGFDGYTQDWHAAPAGGLLAGQLAMEREMETFFRLVKAHPSGAAHRLISLTPTVFDIEQGSLYAYI